VATRTYLALGALLLTATIINACTETPAATGKSSSTSSSGGGGDDDDDDNGSTSSSGSNTSSSGGSGAGAHCEGLAKTCGGTKDCCTAADVPGGTFNRSNDPGFPATISDFKLDVYEVTVGRFRAFVDAGQGTKKSPPKAGAGAHPKIADSGWSDAFNENLADDTATLKGLLVCREGFELWSDAPGANENKPMNCITWFDALAFCAWDGGRLPTEAEWNYAAAGGSEQREYPFAGAIDNTKASFNCGESCSLSNVLAVGSKPAGDGKFGHADMAGNIWEWTLDYGNGGGGYRLTSCDDCADLKTAANRSFRGGGFPNEASYLTTGTRLDDVPTDRDYDVGVRCARAK